MFALGVYGKLPSLYQGANGVGDDAYSYALAAWEIWHRCSPFRVSFFSQNIVKFIIFILFFWKIEKIVFPTFIEDHEEDDSAEICRNRFNKLTIIHICVDFCRKILIFKLYNFTVNQAEWIRMFVVPKTNSKKVELYDKKGNFADKLEIHSSDIMHENNLRIGTSMFTKPDSPQKVILLTVVS